MNYIIDTFGIVVFYVGYIGLGVWAMQTSTLATIGFLTLLWGSILWFIGRPAWRDDA